VALANLERLGCITHGTRYVTIIDRRRLERVTCECYATAKGRFDESVTWFSP
jgi:hypothetical protein